MKDIILINGFRTEHPVLPAGIGYVAQAIENAGFDYDVCDVNIQTHEKIIQIVNEMKPKYVGIGTMTYDVEKNYQLLYSIKESVSNVVIILGGPHAIAAQKEIFHECTAVDIVVLGEGEESLVRLLQGIPLPDICGIITRNSIDVASSYEFLNIENIDFPKYHKFDLVKYGNTMQIASSRGCIYKCSFCGAPKFLGSKWRAFTVSRMIEEFEYWHSKGYRKFYFSDSLFALRKKRVIDFCEYIVKYGYTDVVFTADGVRADHLTIELLQHMKKANFKSLSVGVESVNDKTLKMFNKGESFSQIDNAISIADFLGFAISIYLIIGAPEETYEDAIKSIKYPMKYKNIQRCCISRLVPIKGTAYYDYAIEHNLVADVSRNYPEQEVYGYNVKKETHDANQGFYDSLLPQMQMITRFLVMRNKINKSLIALGIRDISVKSLNMLTQISLVPVLEILVNASFGLTGRLIRYLQWRRTLQPIPDDRSN